MPSTTAIYAALSGMNANARSLDVIGNNIANANTTAYKSSRMLFSTQFSRTLSAGTMPSDASGGSNPFQIGLGVTVAGTQRSFAPGTISPTGDSRDLAIEGDGFFMVESDRTQLFTRAGSFRLDSRNDMVTVTGERVLGFAADERGNIIPGAVRPLNIPLGTRTIADATTVVRFSGNLNAAGDLPTGAAVVNLGGTATTGLRAATGAAPPPGPGSVIDPSTRLIDIEDPGDPSRRLFAEGQTLRLSGAEKQGKVLATADLGITAVATLQDLMDFIAQGLSIQTGVGTSPDGTTPGVSLNTATGFLTIAGNTGTVNDLTLKPANFALLSAAGEFVRSAFSVEKASSADGESVRTTYVLYDSLGTPLEADLSFVLVGRGGTGTTWRYYAESRDDTDLAKNIGTGLVRFDTSGRLIDEAPALVTIDRVGTGAATPMTVGLSFGGERDVLTALTDTASRIAATFRDGAPIGTLSAFGVGRDGLITGSFTNGLTLRLGQIALARFTNNEGLVEVGNNNFRPGANSGVPITATPGSLGTGLITGGALELSNVDLGQEFINMVLASTGYSASARVIRTTDELMQQLLVIGR